MSVSHSTDSLISTRSGPAWQRIGTRKRAGMQVPLFSIYSSKSQGIGDCADLRTVVDWCAAAGMSIVQLLPMNEVGAFFCPYDSLSSFALEPMYLSLNEMRSVDGARIDAAEIKELSRRFPLTRQNVDYGIKDAKFKLLWEFYNRNMRSEMAAADFGVYRSENGYWLHDFALYKVIKHYQNGQAWDAWHESYRSRDPAVLEQFEAQHEAEIVFHMWLQWQLSKQLRQVRDHAASKNILIKGDLPILVSRDSADVWAHPEFFKLEFAAGAPADMYCAKGQRWGMPSYHWERIAADDYRYLKEKLRYAGNFYDILRVDHVVGLFRLWSIPFSEPQENMGLHGFFDPREESLWGGQGRTILQVMMETAKMLLCAEDLGTIPPVCKDSLKEFGIPGNDVQRWAKDWIIRHDFTPPDEFRQAAVAMLSTHDTTNWAAWWRHEAGTIDESLFLRRCAERGIDGESVKELLFDPQRSRHGRVRWHETVDSCEKLAAVLGRRPEDVHDFLDMYLNSYGEKEKLWRLFGLAGQMREEPDAEIIRAAFHYTLGSGAIFCIETIIDWLYLSSVFSGDPYQYRINTPGNVSGKNWSLRMPLSLDEIASHPVTDNIRRMLEISGRCPHE